MKRKIVVKHLYNQKDQPVVTLATIKTDKEIASGLAICSKKDQFNGRLGRKIAIGRAFKALNEKNSSREIRRDDATARIIEIQIPLMYKSIYSEQVTERS